MLKGRQSKIIAERCNNGLKEIKVAKPKTGSPILKFKRSTKQYIYDPTIMDQYEKNMVYVKDTAESGEGIFAKKDIKTYES